MCKSKDCQHGKESPIKDWKYRCQFGPDGKRLQNGTVIVGWNDMKTTHPHLAKECLEDPQALMASTRKKIWWVCPNGHKYDSVGSTRCIGGGCRYCENREVLPGFNDMATTHPDLARECLDDPRIHLAGTAKILNWRCGKCGRKYKKSGVDRSINRSRCACSFKHNKTIVFGVNDMRTTHPELAKECLDDPRLHVAGTAKILNWRCGKCGWVYQKAGSKRLRGDGCGCCSYKKIVPGINDLATTHPHLAREFLGDPAKVTAATRKKLWWRCQNGHKYDLIVRARVRRNIGCRICANREILVGYNDMATTHPELAKELVGEPQKHIAGTRNMLRWRCAKCSFEWCATGNSRVSGTRTGCSKCSKCGYDQSKASVFYIVTRPDQLKLGIMNIGTGRLDQHHRSGWIILDTIELSGESARRLESTAKKMLKKKGILTGAKAFREKFDGYTEAWNAVDLYVRSIRGLCRKLGVNLEAFLAS